MRNWDIKKTVYAISDFVSWSKAGHLELSPMFQRRPVWKLKAKSYFIDTVYRGLPVPIIFLRERTDIRSLATVREVVDGQQRLRTVLSYISPKDFKNLKNEPDEFFVYKIHNKDLSEKSFEKLTDKQKQKILDYQFSVHVLPSDTDDAELLQIFARMNATGVNLNEQELRNAKFYGEFKTVVYEAALENLDRWRKWKIFTEDRIARMAEVELTSELFMFLLEGAQQKTQTNIDRVYEKYDDEFLAKKEIYTKFDKTMDTIEREIGDVLHQTVFKRGPLFYALFAAVGEILFSGDGTAEKPNKLPKELGENLKHISVMVDDRQAPERVIEATSKRTTHRSSRKTVIDFILENVQ